MYFTVQYLLTLHYITCLHLSLKKQALSLTATAAFVQTQCLGCKTWSSKEEGTFGVCLPIKGAATLLECLDKYTAVEHGVEFKCEHAGAPSEGEWEGADRRITFRNAPPILMLTLGRFKCEGKETIKLNDEVCPPASLNT